MNAIEKTIKNVLAPLLFVVIVVGLTHLLFSNAGGLKTPEVHTTVPGVGVAVPQPLVLQWEPYYGGGMGIDSVVARSGESLRVATAVDGGWYGARAPLLDTNVTDSFVSFSVRVHDWTAVDRVMVLFATGEDFNNYFGLNLTNYFAQPTNNSWYDVVLDQSEFAVIEGQPDWSAVTHVAVRVVSKPEHSTRVWFDEFAVAPQNRGEAVVSLTFDDGRSTVMDAATIMQKYDMRGTAYIIPEYLGTSGYMAQYNIDELATSGWDIAGHGDTNLTTLTASEVETELANMHAYLTEHQYTGSQHFAYPNGGYNEVVRSQTLEYFASARTIDGFQQPPEFWYPGNVNAVTISKNTPVSEIIAAIDQAKEHKTWLILVWHDVSAAPELDYEYHIADFEFVLRYIKKNELEVLPYSEAYDRFVGEND